MGEPVGGQLPDLFRFGDVAGFGSGFVALGTEDGGLDSSGRGAIALVSPDGRTWTSYELPTPWPDSEVGSMAGTLVAGPTGLVAMGGTNSTPGTTLWWSSTSGRAWELLTGYPPLGTWDGPAEGSGLVENGVLLADGERMVAIHTGAEPAAWTSFDGRAWRALVVEGGGPANGYDWPVAGLVLTPIGVLGTVDDGSAWFGVPVT